MPAPKVKEGQPNWPKHEADVRSWLGLSSTVGSGNKWHDVSDGTHKGHPLELVFPLMVDAKATRDKSYSFKRDFWKKWVTEAAKLGKTFMMPVRFEEDGQKDVDVMVVDMDTFRDMYRVYRDYRAWVEKNGS